MGECRNTAIVLAAGQGKRMHSKIQKQFMELDGMPVLCYSLRCFQESPLIRDVILVTGEEYVFWCKEEIVEKYGFTKISACLLYTSPCTTCHFCPEGKERLSSGQKDVKTW